MDEQSFDDVPEQSSENVDEMFGRFETPNVVNRDNEKLHPWGQIGHVSEVNGSGALEVPEFVPTRHELVQLVKYWAMKVLDLYFWWFLYQQYGGDQIRRVHFAERRISRIAECLGDAAVEQTCQEVEADFAKTADAEAWQVFRHGTPEEKEAFQRKVQEELQEMCEDAGPVEIAGAKAVAIPQSELRPIEELADLQRDGGGEVDDHD